MTSKLGSDNQRHEEYDPPFKNENLHFSQVCIQIICPVETAQGFVMFTSIMYCDACLSHYTPDASSRGAKASICQMAPSKLGRQSPVLNMILLVWRPENVESVVNWVSGLLVD